jgi:hypothetical protein
MNSLEKEFVPNKESLSLRELGFKEKCLAKYDKFINNKLDYRFIGTYPFDNCPVHTPAPTFSQAFRWFREEYNLHYIVCKNIQIDGYGYREVIQIPYMEEDEKTMFKTYKEAELECLKELIKIVKNEKSNN